MKSHPLRISVILLLFFLDNFLFVNHNNYYFRKTHYDFMKTTEDIPIEKLFLLALQYTSIYINKVSNYTSYCLLVVFCYYRVFIFNMHLSLSLSPSCCLSQTFVLVYLYFSFFSLSISIDTIIILFSAFFILPLYLCPYPSVPTHLSSTHLSLPICPYPSAPTHLPLPICPLPICPYPSVLSLFFSFYPTMFLHSPSLLPVFILYLSLSFLFFLSVSLACRLLFLLLVVFVR